jgi:1,2-phenylacetyl-CoA epoxidase PaaB subunit
MEMINPGLKDVCLAEISKEMKYQVRPATWDWVTNGNPLVGRIPGQLNPNNEQMALIQAMDNLVRERAVESNTAVRTSPMDIAVGTKQAVTSLPFVPRRHKVWQGQGCELSTPTRMRIMHTWSANSARTWTLERSPTP